MSSSYHISEQASPVIANNFTVNQKSNFILATISDDNILYVNLSTMVLPSSTASTMNATNNRTSSQSMFDSKMIIPLYVVIFMLSIIGNSLVLATLIRNKRMRTVTNVYLLNLALSDLLLGVFCMPFTLVGQVLRNFIFGAAMCKLIPYFQAVSVSVGVWTLVAISLERYFAICRPLKSRRWQTQFHAYKMIAMVWLASLLWSAPVLGVSTLKAMKAKGHKCREEWPSRSSEQAYNLFLDGTLLLIPLLIMSLAYSLIMSKLWKGLKREIQHNTNYQRQMLDRSCSSNETSKVDVSPSEFEAPKYYQQNNRLAPPPCNVRLAGGGSVTTAAVLRKSAKPGRTTTVKMWLLKGIQQVRLPVVGQYRQYNNSEKSRVKPRCELTIPSSDKSPSNGHLCSDTGDSSLDETTYHFSRHAIRSNYMDKSIEAKKKVIRMLFVIVAEFFVCWAPLHILNTWYLFYPEQVYRLVGSTGVALVQLLAYISSCCNPITYCFMNRKFRQAFLTIFSCYSCCYCCLCQESESSKMTSKSGTQRNGILKVAHNSEASVNDSTVYLGRASTIARSEVVVLEAEDRV